LGISNKSNTSRDVYKNIKINTIVDWYNLCRDVAVAIFQNRKKMGGPGLVMQIDESLFQGKRGNIIVED